MKSMRNMCWISGVVVALAFATTPGFARTKHNGPVDRLQEITSKLHLSSNQQKKVNVILTDLRTQVAGLREKTSTSADKKTVHHEIEKAMHDSIKQISDVLTSKQRKKFHELLEENHAAHKAHKPATQPAT